MIFASRFSWPRYLAWARVLLAAVALGRAATGPNPSYPLVALLGLFLVAGVLAGLTGKGQRGLLGLLALFADTVYFLIVANYSGTRLHWLASIFYLYLLTEGLAFYGPVEVGVVTAVSALFCTVLPAPQNRVLVPTVLVAGVLACGFAVNRRRQSRLAEELAAKLEAAEKAANKAGEEERQRIANDFHDGPLQGFISLQMRLEILRKLLERDIDEGMEDLRQLQGLALSQVRDLRAFVHSMRPVDVDGANLIATARRTAEAFQKESNIPVTFMGTNKPVGLPQEMSLEALQMLREALHNVQKHAGATRVAVAVEKTDRGLEISVDDNGHGFNFAGTYSLEELELLRLGPASLKRRARSLNAELLLESRPGRGAGIKFRIPLQ